MSRLPSAFTGYVTIQRHTTIPIWYDSRIIKVFIEDIQPNVDTVILQTQKAANVVLLPPSPVDDDFFRKFMNNRNQIQSIGDFFIPFSGTSYSLKKHIPITKNNPGVLVEPPVVSTAQDKEHAELFLKGLGKRILPTALVTDIYSESKEQEEKPEKPVEPVAQPHAQLFLSALKERQNCRLHQSVANPVLEPVQELKINMLEVQQSQQSQCRSKEEIDKTEFMALVARGRRDGNFAKIHKEYLLKKYNVVVHKK